MFPNPANVGNLIYFSLQILIWRKLETEWLINKTLPVSMQLQSVPSKKIIIIKGVKVLSEDRATNSTGTEGPICKASTPSSSPSVNALRVGR